MPANIPVARYRFTAVMRSSVRLPGYAGSLLRGQFGAALREVACMTRQRTCTGCPLLSTCPYIRVFEAVPPPEHSLQKFSSIPNAYIVEPPVSTPDLADSDLQANEPLVFHMVLVGAAIVQLPLILFAWQRALEQGLTRDRVQADLHTVEWLDATGAAQVIWQADAPTLLDHTATISIPQLNDLATGQPPPSSLTLNIQTPLRLQHQGRPLRPDQLTPRTLVAALARRTALVMEFHAGQSHWGESVPPVVQLAEALQDERELHWYDWTRYSSRQQQEMTLGGVLGRWTLTGNPAALAAIWPWLWLGQWMHVGKNATMGMGGYTLQATP